ncbi:2-dehydropantoate 2-reductase [Aurantimonas endophytica]|uniref:2-dehydropantoate 2-reductase n=1 Tax=Aurantimonas endophytica TaxID=1522175 RepID=A0A7W6HBA1_9HYPH|nr:2-dehydropantoate 2-reductase [Aurantimonas endophytica]MBB4001988.1 2-dehydropantoate 2-reductase [Aurantimonas endophytica]MCO6402379.1 2-dehydropantoate 2-reductase [Aurantimonas endophytica]
MRICIFGAGAIGGLVAAKLAATGDAEVSVVARGPHLAAICENGLTVRDAAGETNVAVQATEDPSELGPQDYVFVALKAHSVPAILPGLVTLLGPDTAVVTAQNGVPWWYFHRSGGPYEGHRVEAVDPGGKIWDTIGPERAIGCVVHPAADIEAPGIIRHTEGDRLPLGEPSGEKSERTLALSRALVAAGFRAPVRPQIRSEIWIKLWGNVSLNPISALTGATLAAICGNEGTRAVARQMMLEAQAIAEKLDIRFPIDVDKRIAGAAEVGEHKTSMLQDLELGRPMEIDALVTAVQELGRLTDSPTPTIDTVLGLVRLRAATPLVPTLSDQAK